MKVDDFVTLNILSEWNNGNAINPTGVTGKIIDIDERKKFPVTVIWDCDGENPIENCYSVDDLVLIPK